MPRLRPTPLLALACALATACGSFPRRLEYHTMTSPAMRGEMAYALYTPPGWTPRERLPLVLFLHGGGDDEDCFDRHGVGLFLDEAVARGDAPRCVIAVPDGRRGFWENFYDGSRRYRDWVLQDLLPHVRERCNTLPGREHLAVCGISMGGHGALRFAHLEGERFGAAAALSAPVMDAEHLVEFTQRLWVRLFVPVERIWGPTDDVDRVRRDDLFAQWRRPADLRGVRLLLAHGDRDRDDIMLGCDRFHEHLEDRGVPHEYFVFDGGHAWVAWKPILPRVLTFLVGGAR